MRREDIVQQSTHQRLNNQDTHGLSIVPGLGKKGLLNGAIELANAQLRKLFGMQIIPLPPSLESKLLLPSASNSARRKQAVAQAVKASHTPNTVPMAYALVSSLPDEEANLLPARNSIPAELALLQVILVTIALSGGVLDYHDLRNALMDVNLYTASLNDPEIGALDALLAKFTKQRHLVKARNPADTSSHIFTWGPRAFVEFPIESLTELIYTVQILCPSHRLLLTILLRWLLRPKRQSPASESTLLTHWAEPLDNKTPCNKFNLRRASPTLYPHNPFHPATFPSLPFPSLDLTCHFSVALFTAYIQTRNTLANRQVLAAFVLGPSLHQMRDGH
jgi:hypothetical protein